MVHFKVSTETNISFKVKSANIPMSVDQGKVVYTGGKRYDGDYTVTPDIVVQTLPTAGKLLNEDMIVLEIPLYEVSNQQNGTTAIIGGIKYGLQ